MAANYHIGPSLRAARPLNNTQCRGMFSVAKNFKGSHTPRPISTRGRGHCGWKKLYAKSSGRPAENLALFHKICKFVRIIQYLPLAHFPQIA